MAGIRTPEDLNTMKNCMPEAYQELVENCEILERHYKDMMVRLFIHLILFVFFEDLMVSIMPFSLKSK